MKHAPTVAGILLGLLFIMKGAGLFDPMLIGIVLLAGYLLFAGRKGFAALAN